MSGTEIQTDDGPGIRDILERMDGGQPTNLLQPDEPARHDPEPLQEDAEADRLAAEKMRQTEEEAFDPLAGVI